eukprot:CAMPEP_0194442998 /NCGR_PEP_ID=MMETSP0176-20130528/126452_1 /TAXON_ID=216777 /ORGANISM="Proboscia alata, Strain PI-D3" /LENGTH=781 /DNA_ID=CAMNT_0039269179 /DNA_START=370 /DNA_END=2716 /DNA_ORIENTATION=+
MSEEILKQSSQLGNLDRPQVAILDFGSQYSHLIARRVRELHVYCELYSCKVPVAKLAAHTLTAVILSGGPNSVYEEGAPHVDPELWQLLKDRHVYCELYSCKVPVAKLAAHTLTAVILCGGPNSVYEEGAPHVDPELWQLLKDRNVPVLGICYGMQELAHVFGGKVAPGLKREYGKAMVLPTPDTSCPLFTGIPAGEFSMWMSHGDKLHTLPDGFHSIASTSNADHVAIQNLETRMWGLQFHPEVTHSPSGPKILENFVVGIAGGVQDWKMSNYAEEFIQEVRLTVGEEGHVIGAVSGGVDSTVAAVLMNRAIGDRFHAVMVDNGCLRKDEATTVLKRLRGECGIDLKCVDASEQFLGLLKGVTDPEQKRKIIGGTFIDIFEVESKKITELHGRCDFLLQGTLYPDVIESISYKGPSATIKTHHNVGGLPARMKLKLIEPLRDQNPGEFRGGDCRGDPGLENEQFAEEFIQEVRLTVGEEGHVIGAVSGGVDSTVAAVLMNRAIGDRFHAVMVDNGCLRKDEATTVLKRLRGECGIDLKCVDASDQFLGLLKGVTDPEQKRKIIGGTFIDIFEVESKKITELHGRCDFLLQGTLYPDVIESISYKGPSATIKTHHNVGGLPARMKLKLIEPLRELFKDEVRELGMAMGIDEFSVWRHPFPGPGLAIRILGEVTAERVAILQHADDIMIQELRAADLYRHIGQAFVVLLPVKSVGVMGDGRTYENVAAVRCVETTDYMTADFFHLPYDVMGKMSNRIINEVRGINRLCYDISSKPPATIEWE